MDPFKVYQALLTKISQSKNIMLTSDVARPLSYKTKTTYFFKTNTKTGQAKTKTTFFKDYQIINPRPQKTFPYRKFQASHADFTQSCQNYAGNRKKLLITKNVPLQKISG